MMRYAFITLSLLAGLAATPAFAFTTEGQSGSATNGASHFSDPDEQFDSSNASQGSGAPISHMNFGNGASATFGVTSPDNSAATNCASYNCSRSALR